FAEARAVKEEVKRCGFQLWVPWFRLHVGERDWAEALKIVDHYKNDKTTASYLRAVVYLRQGDAGRARPEVEVLRQAAQQRKHDVAEEAFLEALAHDAGSVRAALGLQVVCERQGRSQEAHRYADLAHKFWRRALARDFDAELSWLRHPPVRDDRTSKLPPGGD